MVFSGYGAMTSSWRHQNTEAYTDSVSFALMSSSGSDCDAAASNLQQNLLKEAYCTAACALADLQCTLDGMDEALVTEARRCFLSLIDKL